MRKISIVLILAAMLNSCASGKDNLNTDGLNNGGWEQFVVLYIIFQVFLFLFIHAMDSPDYVGGRIFKEKNSYLISIIPLIGIFYVIFCMFGAVLSNNDDKNN